MPFAVGSMVRARGREWVVLPGSADGVVMLRPLGGSDDEITGIYTPLESVESAQFALPDPDRPGDHNSARLLRDAVRLGFRSSGGPFRSFGSLAVEPYPYQLVPLLMALKLDPVRLLIADDVGIGKTVEAALIARELIDRGEVERLAVLCPSHLVEQWQAELREKFRLETVAVLPSTFTRLARDCGPGQSLFSRYPHVVVSIDFIKSERHRDDFLRHCPEFVIVDEAHTCVAAATERARSSSHQRHHLLHQIAREASRHLVLVTATPHSGKEEAFRALLTLLNPTFADLPSDLAGEENRWAREHLAAHLVQRRRIDVKADLSERGKLPDREAREEVYALAPAYKRLFDDALAYAQERVGSGEVENPQQRLRWWSVLALLRALASSPAAAAATLHQRSGGGEAGESAADDLEGEADLLAAQILDPMDEAASETSDLVPTTDLHAAGATDSAHRKRLATLATQATALLPGDDAKLATAAAVVSDLLAEGYSPVLFCRFIQTAEYVARELPRLLKIKGEVAVEAVTSTLPASEREDRVQRLAAQPRRVLVCTDCLSEGLNLQERFDAVIHYDLAWNPTRHEQREGRVDRLNQPRAVVRIVTLYSPSTLIDGIVLNVLLRKSSEINKALGISIPLPVDTAQVVQAIFESLQIRAQQGRLERKGFEGTLFSQEEMQRTLSPKAQQLTEALHATWTAAAEREKRSRTLYAQRSIQPEVVAQEMAEARAAIGSGIDVQWFVQTALAASGVPIGPAGADPISADFSDRESLRLLLGLPRQVTLTFSPPAPGGALCLQRTHPVVATLAAQVLDTALDPYATAIADRCGVIRTRAVTRRSTVLLLRCRYHIVVRRRGTERPLLAEELVLAAFEGAPDRAVWLERPAAEALLTATVDAPIAESERRMALHRIIDRFDHVRPYLDALATERGAALLAAHRRVRDAARGVGNYQIEPHRPPDVVGLYVYLPAAEGTR